MSFMNPTLGSSLRPPADRANTLQSCPSVGAFDRKLQKLVNQNVAKAAFGLPQLGRRLMPSPIFENLA